MIRDFWRENTKMIMMMMMTTTTSQRRRRGDDDDDDDDDDDVKGNLIIPQSFVDGPRFLAGKTEHLLWYEI